MRTWLGMNANDTYVQSGRQPTEVPVCGSWNLRDKKMFDTKKLVSWAVVSFAEERELPQQVGGGVVWRLNLYDRAVGVLN